MIKTVHRHRFWAGILRLSVAAMLCMAVSSLRAQDYSSFFSGNGSFEFGPPTTNLGFYTGPIAGNVRTYSTDVVTGWHLYGYNQPPRLYEGPEAQDGSRYIGLRSWSGAGTRESGVSIDGYSISHTPFNVGEIYELTFWAAGGVGSSNSVAVGISGGGSVKLNLPDYTQAELDALGGLQWQSFVVPFVATEPSMYLSLRPVTDDVYHGYQSSIFLDNFSITEVPEPGTALLAAAGGLVLLTGRRRRGTR